MIGESEEAIAQVVQPVLVVVGHHLGPGVHGLSALQAAHRRELHGSIEEFQGIGLEHASTVNHDLLRCQMRFTALAFATVKIPYMGQKKSKGIAHLPGPTLTKMGERIVAFMKANGVTNRAQFAESVLGMSRQRFHAWLYKAMGDVEARPLLRCAEVLNTSPEFLLGDTDDPRPGMALHMREFQLVELYRALSEPGQERLLTAAAWVAETESGSGTSTISNPFGLKRPAAAPDAPQPRAIPEPHAKERK